MYMSVNNSVRDVRRYFIKYKYIFMWAPRENIWLCLIPTCCKAQRIPLLEQTDPSVKAESCQIDLELLK